MKLYLLSLLQPLHRVVLSVLVLLSIVSLFFPSLSVGQPESVGLPPSSVVPPALSLSVGLLSEYAEINVGGTVVTTTRVVNHGLLHPKDVILRYILRTIDGEDVLELSETVAVQTSATFVKSIYVPLYLESGNYVIHVKAEYDGRETEATRSIVVLKRERSERGLIYLVLGTVSFISLLFMTLTYAFTKQLIKLQRFVPSLGSRGGKS
ncbi:hypothetical protein HY496_02520 [Candidatus Woesearchaeota archaeon]|nr:hypothetical protein [Candidatus Woesearchaeota archaeon]